MINIISAIGSIGTFIMALFYFVSVSIQLYQMKISFLPALGFNQILLERDNEQLNLMNTTTQDQQHKDYIKLYNLGGGAAKEIKVEVLLGNDKVIQKKYVNILPSKEGYMLPINKKVYEEIKSTIKNNGYEANLNIRMIIKKFLNYSLSSYLGMCIKGIVNCTSKITFNYNKTVAQIL